MFFKSWKVIFITLLITHASASFNKAFAAPPLILEEGKKMYSLAMNLDILEDKEGKLTIEDILSH